MLPRHSVLRFDPPPFALNSTVFGNVFRGATRSFVVEFKRLNRRPRLDARGVGTRLTPNYTHTSYVNVTGIMRVLYMATATCCTFALEKR